MDNQILVTRSSMPELQEYVDEISDMWETHWLTNMGVKHKRLQNELIEFLKVKNIELFTNGHMSLELSLQALGLHGEVITTPYTFASTTHAIVRNRLEPVFCDVNPKTFTIDVDKIEDLITEKTCAIVPVHVYGNICDIEKIESLARQYNLKVVYDAAHCFGITYKGRGVGCFGDVSCFSFHATKVFNTIEGGAACFEDEELGKILYGLKNFGIRDPETVNCVGANAKMNEFCAAMGICNLRHIKEEIEKRKKVFSRYIYHLGKIEGIYLPKIQEDVESNYAYFPIVIDRKAFGRNRDEVFALLASHGVISRKYFYPLTNSFKCYADRFDVDKTPVALELARNVLTLPLYGDLSIEDVEKICDIILKGK